MTRVTTSRPRHLTTGEVDVEIRAARNGGREISDAAALTIASWWQSPGTVGRAFAELSTTGSVDLLALSRDIGATYLDATDPDDRVALDFLGTWAINHPSVN